MHFAYLFACPSWILFAANGVPPTTPGFGTGAQPVTEGEYEVVFVW